MVWYVVVWYIVVWYGVLWCDMTSWFLIVSELKASMFSQAALDCHVIYFEGTDKQDNPISMYYVSMVMINIIRWVVSGLLTYVAYVPPFFPCLYI